MNEEKLTWHYMAHEFPPVGRPVVLMSVDWHPIPKYTVVSNWTEDDNQIRLRYKKNNQFCYWMIIPKLKLSERDDPNAEIERQRKQEKYQFDNNAYLSAVHDNGNFYK